MRERDINRGFPLPRFEDAVYLTAYCDASASPKDGAGYGLWARDSEVRVIAAGPCPEFVTGSMQAEVYAICMAVRVAATLQDVEPATTLVVKSDCQGAIRWFDRRSKSKFYTDEIEAAIRETFATANAMRVRLDIKWVKGHRPSQSSTMAYLNNQVDQLARAARNDRKPFFKRTGVSAPVHDLLRRKP